jgi:threonyl-tRNA synthetase
MSAKTTARHTPVMLHRAIVGSLERFIGILIENHAGALPLWLAPVQVVVTSIIPKPRPTTPQEVAKTLRKTRSYGLRPICATRKLRYKIREHSACRRCPYILVVGDKEKANRTGCRARPRQPGSRA